ncbi:aminotransferase [Candidatus Pantoea edessiphila]|uniref:alanine transaminase n=1 Tax=Candidatus Pantoea edessiphila TaxID=2044610 RepID=A0A2P5T0W6_9GAMM|nr:pyridoxal phosphate-dependent aminotransferase [Candidatus Pantoea edessiphila]PPI88227.1 aminotransferase [Candidatus Pantoea edessiphila]
MFLINKSDRLKNVKYDIRGILLKKALILEEKGNKVIKLNIGNPAYFNFKPPNDIIIDTINHLKDAQGYCDSKGLYSVRKTIMDYYYRNNIKNFNIEDIYIGNGVSELIIQSIQALLNNGDEILVPAPDYPLWTAAILFANGKPVHYLCDEQSDWFPDTNDILNKITKNTKGIVIINPNNPTGAVYNKSILIEIIEIARKYNLIIFSDEIYNKIIFNKINYYSVASLAPDLITVTFNGLSKNFYIAGFRQGWMIINGPKKYAKGYMEGLEVLSAMRLCANVPSQYAIKTALTKCHNIDNNIIPGGRLYEQCQLAYNLINNISGISCVKPKGSFYIFPRIDIKKFNISNDFKMVLDFLLQEKVLLMHGTAFNWPWPDHIRIVILPCINELELAINKFGRFLRNYHQ